MNWERIALEPDRATAAEARVVDWLRLMKNPYHSQAGRA